jgi:molybdenum cofactor cytidylyltransferase
VLAAGAGTRFGSGSSKLLAQLDGRPVLEHAVRAPCAVDALDRVVVVLGAYADDVVARVDFGRAEPVLCPDWERGQSESLRFGARLLADASRVIVTLGDEPLMTPEVIQRFVDAPCPARAAYNGRAGHPVVLGPSQLRALSGLTGDQGARSLLENAALIECSELSSDRDVDTPADLEAIRHEARAVI